MFEALVNTPDYYCEKLQWHLDKTERSYQRLLLDLAAGANMNAACDFYLGAASLTLDMPIMLIKPKQRSERRGMVYYEFYQEFLFPEDKGVVQNPACVQRSQLLHSILCERTC